MNKISFKVFFTTFEFVSQLKHLQNRSIHVIHHLAVQTLNVKLWIKHPRARVCQNSRDPHRIVDQNVLAIASVQFDRLVLIRNAKIHVLVCAELTLNAAFSVILQFVLVVQDSLEILLFNAIPFKVSLSLLILFLILKIEFFMIFNSQDLYIKFFFQFHLIFYIFSYWRKTFTLYTNTMWCERGLQRIRKCRCLLLLTWLHRKPLWGLQARMRREFRLYSESRMRKIQVPGSLSRCLWSQCHVQCCEPLASMHLYTGIYRRSI